MPKFTIEAGTRSRILVRLSGMNIYYARTSKLVSDFLYLERSLVHNFAQSAGSAKSVNLAGPDCGLKAVGVTKNPKTVLSSLGHKYSFLIVSP